MGHELFVRHVFFHVITDLAAGNHIAGDVPLLVIKAINAGDSVHYFVAPRGGGRWLGKPAAVIANFFNYKTE